MGVITNGQNVTGTVPNSSLENSLSISGNVTGNLLSLQAQITLKHQQLVALGLALPTEILS